MNRQLFRYYMGIISPQWHHYSRVLSGIMTVFRYRIVNQGQAICRTWHQSIANSCKTFRNSENKLHGIKKKMFYYIMYMFILKILYLPVTIITISDNDMFARVY